MVFFTFNIQNGAIAILEFEYFNQSTSMIFANQSIAISPQSVKMTLTVKNWKFSSVKNSFELVFDSNFTVPVTQYDECFSQGYDNIGNLRWFMFTVGTTSLYSQFLPLAELDNVPRSISLSYNNGNSSTANNGQVIITAGHFWDSIVIDPDFAVLVDSTQSSGPSPCGKSNTNAPASGLSATNVIVIAVVIPAVVITLIIATVLLSPKKKKFFNIFSIA